MAGKKSWVVAAAAMLLAGACYGQDALVEEMYGRGVHAFFSNNMGEAFNALNASILNGSRDPRAFYYRGLVFARTGRPEEAREDIRKATELEMLGGVPYPVGRSLERIQGPERMMLEGHRRAAKLELHSQILARDRARYEQIQRTRAEELRGGGSPAPLRLPSDLRPDTSDPFGPPPTALPPPAVVPAPIPAPPPAAPTPMPPAAPDPFATPPAEA